jgi:opacity protein-like surface antigen
MCRRSRRSIYTFFSMGAYHLKKIAVFLSILVLCSGLTQATEILFSARASYFSPTEQAFKDIYGGGLKFGGTMAVNLFRDFDIFVSGSFLTKTGELSYTKEETKLSIVPVVLGLQYRIKSGKFQPFFGIGAGYFSFKESNIIGDVNKNGFGFTSKVGALFFVTKTIFLQLYSDYSYCKMTPADFTINIGGIEAGLGLGVVI